MAPAVLIPLALTLLGEAAKIAKDLGLLENIGKKMQAEGRTEMTAAERDQVNDIKARAEARFEANVADAKAKLGRT